MKEATCKVTLSDTNNVSSSPAGVLTYNWAAETSQDLSQFLDQFSNRRAAGGSRVTTEFLSHAITYLQ